MKFTDNNNSYGVISVINHWLITIVVITMLSIGIYMDSLPEGDAQSWWTRLHISIGATAFIFVIFRVVWRLLNKTPTAMPQARPLQILSKSVHHLLLLGITIMILSGPIMVWTAGYPVSAFGIVEFPSPTGEMENLNELLEEVHGITAWTVLTLLVLHILGTLKHVVINRDGTLARMFGKRVQ